MPNDTLPIVLVGSAVLVLWVANYTCTAVREHYQTKGFLMRMENGEFTTMSIAELIGKAQSLANRLQTREQKLNNTNTAQPPRSIILYNGQEVHSIVLQTVGMNPRNSHLHLTARTMRCAMCAPVLYPRWDATLQSYGRTWRVVDPTMLVGPRTYAGDLVARDDDIIITDSYWRAQQYYVRNYVRICSGSFRVTLSISGRLASHMRPDVILQPGQTLDLGSETIGANASMLRGSHIAMRNTIIKVEYPW